MAGSPRGPLNSTLYNTIIVVVLVVWVVNFAARFLVPGYQPAPQIDAIFMAIAGGAMALNKMSVSPGSPDRDDTEDGVKPGGHAKRKGD